MGWETAVASAAATLFCSEFYSSLNSDPSGSDFMRAFTRAQRSLLSCHFAPIDPADTSELARLRVEFGRRSLVAAGIPRFFTAQDMVQQKLDAMKVQITGAHEDLARAEYGVPSLFLLLPKLRTRSGIPLFNTMVVVFLCPIDGKIAKYGGKIGLKFQVPMGWVNALARFRKKHPFLMSLSAMGVGASLKLLSGLNIGDVVPASCMPSDSTIAVADFLGDYVKEVGADSAAADLLSCLAEEVGDQMVDGEDEAVQQQQQRQRQDQQRVTGQRVKGQQYRQFEDFLASIGFDSKKLEMHTLVGGPDSKAQWVSSRHQSWPQTQTQTHTSPGHV